MGVQPEEHAVIHDGGDALGAVTVKQELLGTHGHRYILIFLLLGADGMYLGTVAGERFKIGLAVFDDELALYDVGAADKGGDKEVCRTLVYALGRADVLNDACVHNCDTVGDRHGLLLVMRDVHRRDADAVLDVLDDSAHLDTELCVKVRQRLVHQKNVRLDAQCTSERDALLLTAGKALRHTVGVLVDLHELHELLGLGLYLVLGELLVFQAELNVFSDGVVREDGVVLEDHANVALGGVKVVDALLTEVEVAALNAVEARYHSQKSGLAAAGGTKQREKLALFNVKAQIGNDDIVTVLFKSVLYDDFFAHLYSLLYIIAYCSIFSISIIRRVLISVRRLRTRGEFFSSTGSSLSSTPMEARSRFASSISKSP